MRQIENHSHVFIAKIPVSFLVLAHSEIENKCVYHIVCRKKVVKVMIYLYLYRALHLDAKKYAFSFATQFASQALKWQTKG